MLEPNTIPDHPGASAGYGPTNTYVDIGQFNQFAGSITKMVTLGFSEVKSSVEGLRKELSKGRKRGTSSSRSPRHRDFSGSTLNELDMKILQYGFSKKVKEAFLVSSAFTVKHLYEVQVFLRRLA